MPKGSAAGAKGATEKRGKMVSLKVTDQEFTTLQETADEYHVSVSEYIRIMCLAKHLAKEIEGRLGALNAIAGGPGAATLIEQEPVWRIGAIVSDALRAVEHGEETLRALKGLLVPAMLEVKRVLEDQRIIPTGEPKEG